MTFVLNHTIVCARDKHRSARFFAGLMGLDVVEPTGPFVPVRVNHDLTLDFDDRHEFQFGHYGFLVDDATFDAVLARLEGSTIDFGSGLGIGKDHHINHLGGGRGVYVREPSRHRYELFTAVP